MDPDAHYAEVVELYGRHLNPGLARLMAFAGFGVETHAEGCYLTDHEGRRYLDCLGGYGTFALGHRHPRVIEAVRRQLDHLALSGKAFFSENQARLARQLAEVAPEGLTYSFFCNSGAEAVEAALKFAKIATGRAKIVSTHGGYHGKTLGALAATGREKYRHPAEPLMPGVVFIPFGDAQAAVEAIDDETAAILVEPIQGEGGINLPPERYFDHLRQACDRHGALLIADEVQTGLGRTGMWFEMLRSGVSPDLMTLAKQLGGGVMPIGALMGTAAVWDRVYGLNPLIHTSTFGGSPIACAAALATLEALREDDLISVSAERGAQMLQGLRAVAGRHPDLILEARGRGLMIGVEFQMDEVGELTIAQMLKRGLCAAYTLNNPRVMRFEPPLIISTAEVDWAVETFEAAVIETEEILAEVL